MEFEDLKLNSFGEFLYPIQGLHGGQKMTIWVFDSNPFKHKNKYNSNGNPFKAQDYIQFNVEHAGKSHVYRTFDDPVATTYRRNGQFLEKYRKYVVRSPDDYRLFDVFIKTIEEK